MGRAVSTDFKEVKKLARESLMPDYFAVRIDEEGLWNTLQELLSRIRPQPPVASIDRMKQVAKESSTANDFIEKLKEENLWTRFRDLVSKLPIK
jgi:hypothetical protein